MPENNEYVYNNETVEAVEMTEYPVRTRDHKPVDAGGVVAIAGLVVLAWEGVKFGAKWAKSKIDEAMAAKAAMDAQKAQAQQAPREYVYAEEPEAVKANKKK